MHFEGISSYTGNDPLIAYGDLHIMRTIQHTKRVIWRHVTGTESDVSRTRTYWTHWRQIV